MVPRPRSASSSARSNGFGKGFHQLPVGARVVLPAEDRASGHGELRAGAPDVGDVLLADAPVHLDEEILVQLLPELREKKEMKPDTVARLDKALDEFGGIFQATGATRL